MSFAPRARARSGARTALSTKGRWVAAALVVGGLAACTSSPGEPPLTGTPSLLPTAAAPTPSPGLTPLDTVSCTVTRELPSSRDLLPAPAIWPTGTADGRGQTFETVAVAAAHCAGQLPTSVCRPSPPWDTSLRDEFVVASGAVRLVDSSSEASLADPSSNGVGVPNRQSVRYSQVILRAGDPRGTIAYLERALRQCASGAPQTLGGHTRLVGTTPSDYRQGPATIVLLTKPAAAAWLVVDGTMQITERELARIVTLAASRLLPS